MKAILCHLRWRENAEPASRGRWYVAALACAALAILSKPSTVMLPVALALLGWWKARRVAWRDVFPLAPFFVLSAAAAASIVVAMLRAVLDPMMGDASIYASVVLLGVAYVALVKSASRFPDIEVDDPENSKTPLPELNHRLTHLHLCLKPVLVTIPATSGLECQQLRENSDTAWFEPHEWNQLGLPKPISKLLHQLEGTNSE